MLFVYNFLWRIYIVRGAVTSKMYEQKVKSEHNGFLLSTVAAVYTYSLLQDKGESEVAHKLS